MILAFLAPALLLYGTFVLYPIIQSTRYSLYDWNGLESLDNFVGLDNFRRAFSDANFTAALKHNVIIIVLSLALQVPFALGLAMLLNSRIKGRAVLRTLFFAPYVLSEVVTGVVWRQILRPNGLLDEMMTSIGLGSHTQGWLSDPDVVLYALFFVISWKYFGFHMVIILAGLQQIPKELGEAASIDGATSWQKFRYVTLPLLGPTIRVLDLPVDHRRVAAVRPRVGHHEGRPDRGVVDDGDVPLRPVPQEPLRIRQRRVDRDLHALAGDRAAVSAVRLAT